MFSRKAFNRVKFNSNVSTINSLINSGYSINNTLISELKSLYSILNRVSADTSLKYSIYNDLLVSAEALYSIFNALNTGIDALYNIYDILITEVEADYAIVKGIHIDGVASYLIYQAAVKELSNLVREWDDVIEVSTPNMVNPYGEYSYDISTIKGRLIEVQEESGKLFTTYDLPLESRVGELFITGKKDCDGQFYKYTLGRMI